MSIACRIAWQMAARRVDPSQPIGINTPSLHSMFLQVDLLLRKGGWLLSRRLLSRCQQKVYTYETTVVNEYSSNIALSWRWIYWRANTNCRKELPPWTPIERVIRIVRRSWNQYDIRISFSMTSIQYMLNINQCHRSRYHRSIYRRCHGGDVLLFFEWSTLTRGEIWKTAEMWDRRAVKRNYGIHVMQTW